MELAFTHPASRPMPQAPAIAPTGTTDAPQELLPRLPEVEALVGRPTISRELSIIGERAEMLWRVYEQSFAPLAALAMQQHVWTREEILAELANSSIVKFVGWQDGEPVGLCMVTSELDAVPMISPEFLRARYPEQASRDAVFYGIVIFVRVGYRGRTLFARLGTHAGQEAASRSGVIIFDVCSFNRANGAVDENLRRLAQAFPNSSMDLIDQQSWFAIEVPEPLSEFRRGRARR
jgi:hypothetical protein